MVSKQPGSRPPAQCRSKRRGDQGPDLVDRPAEPQAGSSTHDRPTPSGSRSGGERTVGATGGGHSHTLPLGTSVPTGSQQGAARADRAAKGGRAAGGKHSQTLLMHGARAQGARGRTAAPGDATGGPSSHRGTASTGLPPGPPPLPSGAARPTTGSTRNFLRAEVSQEQSPRDPNERFLRHGAPHTLPATHHHHHHPQAASSHDQPPPRPPLPKERHCHQGQHRQQAATLPPGGASGSGGARLHHPASRHAPVPARPPAAAASLARTSGSVQYSSSATAQAQRASSSRDSHTAERRHPPSAVAVAQGGTRERDIARITIDARTIVTRPMGGARNNLPTEGTNAFPLGAHGSSGASGSVLLQQATASSRQQCPTHRRNPAPAPPASAGAGAAGNPVPVLRGAVAAAAVSSQRAVTDPTNLRLDIVDVEASGHILTNNLSAGISYSRPERLETTEALPDILNSHILPPYTVRQNQHRASRADQYRVSGSGGGGRSAGSGGGGRSQRRTRSRAGMTQLDDDGKACCSHEGCLRCVTAVTTFRWVLVSLALLGVICVVTGIVLGALHMTVGSSFLTLSLMFIGLGVMLVIVVGVGWKCTPQGHEPCHLLFNLGDHCTRDVRSASSHRRHRDRNHWYGGGIYPEFRYRRPPPSYSASMQEFQQQLMLAQIQLNQDPTLPPGENDDNYSLPSSPPPSYKSHASTTRPGLHITFPPQGASYPSSQPPTYRSRGTAERPSLNMEQGGVDNLACSDVDAPWSTSSAASSSVTSPSSSNRTSPARSLPDSGSSTLHRAADRVVDYLDDVLQQHNHTLEHAFAERPSRPVTGGAVVVVESPPRPDMGAAVVVVECPARSVTRGDGVVERPALPVTGSDGIEDRPVTGGDNVAEYPARPVSGGVAKAECPARPVSGSGGEVERPARPVTGCGGAVECPAQPVVRCERAVECPARPVTGSGGAVERPSRPVTGSGGVVERPFLPVNRSGGVVERPARPVTGSGGVVEHPFLPVNRSGGVVERPARPVTGSGGVVEHPFLPVNRSGGVVERLARPVTGSRGAVERLARPVTGSGGVVERPTRPVTGSGGVVGRPARPVTGGGGMADCPARTATGGAGLGAQVKTAIDTLESARVTIVTPGGHHVTSGGAGGMTSGVSLSSVHTTTSLEETDRIQDTQL